MIGRHWATKTFPRTFFREFTMSSNLLWECPIVNWVVVWNIFYFQLFWGWSLLTHIFRGGWGWNHQPVDGQDVDQMIQMVPFVAPPGSSLPSPLKSYIGSLFWRRFATQGTGASPPEACQHWLKGCYQMLPGRIHVVSYFGLWLFWRVSESSVIAWWNFWTCAEIFSHLGSLRWLACGSRCVGDFFFIGRISQQLY